MRKRYIAGNWKMNLTRAEAVALAKEMVEKLPKNANKYMLAPSFTLLQDVSKVLKGSSILLGAQNMSLAEKGAYTGDISPLQLLDVGVKVVILGHIFLETDDMINAKLKLALKSGLEVILCVGEELVERETGRANTICEEQLKKGLQGVSSSDLAKVTIAYEPVWAIGTGKSATPKDANDMHIFIRSIIASLYDKQASEEMVIQYGGSMKVDNAKSLLAMPNIDGGLIGGASLKADSLAKIALM